MIPVMFAYTGWNAASYVAEEIRDPSRNVPLALAIGTAAVIAIYVLLNVLYLYVLPMLATFFPFSITLRHVWLAVSAIPDS